MNIERLMELLDLLEVYYYYKKNLLEENNPKRIDIEYLVDSLTENIEKDIAEMKEKGELFKKPLSKK